MAKNVVKIDVMSTQDFDLEAIKTLFAGGSHLECDVSDSQMFFKSAGEVPSWLQFAASFSNWITIAAGVSGATVVASITNDLYSFSKRIVKAKTNAKPHTKIRLSVPYPSEQNPCILEINGEEWGEVADQIIDFSIVANSIHQKLIERNVANKQLASPISIQIGNNEVILQWVELPEFEKIRVIIAK